MDKEKKDVGKWWVWIFFLIVMSVLVLTGLRYFGLIGGTIVERVVFENSMQYTEARKTQIATFEAQLIEINGQLSNPSLEAGTRHNLETSASVIRVQLNAARSL